MANSTLQSADLGNLARSAARQAAAATVESLLLDRVRFPRRVSSGEKDGKETYRLAGHGEYVVVLRSTLRKSTAASSAKTGDDASATGSVPQHPSDLQAEWLYVEWQEQETILIASGIWEKVHPGNSASVKINHIGLAKISNNALTHHRGATVKQLADNAIVKIKDLSQRELYSVLSKFNGQGRDGFVVEAGSLK